MQRRKVPIHLLKADVMASCSPAGRRSRAEAPETLQASSNMAKQYQDENDAWFIAVESRMKIAPLRWNFDAFSITYVREPVNWRITAPLSQSKEYWPAHMLDIGRVR